MDFGKVSGSEELAISPEVVLGYCEWFQVNEGDSRMGMAVQWREVIAGNWVDLGDEFGVIC